MYSRQFEFSNMNMEDIKHRVKSWVSASPDYFLEVISERHVKVKKIKHDTKVCCYGCVFFPLVTFGGAFLLMGSLYQLGLAGLFGFIFLAMMTIPIFIAWFCLYPNKVEFDVQFSNELPIKALIIASGNMLEKNEYEYNSFLDALDPSKQDKGLWIL